MYIPEEVRQLCAQKYAPQTFPSLLPLLGLSRDTETEITVKSAVSLKLTNAYASYILVTHCLVM